MALAQNEIDALKDLFTATVALKDASQKVNIILNHVKQAVIAFPDAITSLAVLKDTEIPGSEPAVEFDSAYVAAKNALDTAVTNFGTAHAAVIALL